MISLPKSLEWTCIDITIRNKPVDDLKKINSNQEIQNGEALLSLVPLCARVKQWLLFFFFESFLSDRHYAKLFMLINLINLYKNNIGSVINILLKMMKNYKALLK